MSAITDAEVKVTKKTPFTTKNKTIAVITIMTLVAFFLETVDDPSFIPPSVVDRRTKNHARSKTATIMMVFGLSIVANRVMTITIAAMRI